MTAGNGDEDLAAQAGQAAAAAGADPLGAGDEVAGTDVMIMIGGDESRRTRAWCSCCYNVTINGAFRHCFALDDRIG